MNVGIYYMANAFGRLTGTVLSGWLYQSGSQRLGSAGGIRGLIWCLLASAGFALLAGALSRRLPEPQRAPPCCFASKE